MTLDPSAILMAFKYLPSYASCLKKLTNFSDPKLVRSKRIPLPPTPNMAFLRKKVTGGRRATLSKYVNDDFVSKGGSQITSHIHLYTRELKIPY